MVKGENLAISLYSTLREQTMQGTGEIILPNWLSRFEPVWHKRQKQNPALDWQAELNADMRVHVMRRLSPADPLIETVGDSEPRIKISA